MFAVLHVPAQGTSLLPGILSRAGPLPAAHAADGGPLEHGTIELDAVNRRGRSIRCRITASPMAGSDGTARGTILVMDPIDEA